MKLQSETSFSQNERLIIDGNHFVNCVFERVQMEFHASGEAYFTDCTFLDNHGVVLGFGAEVLRVVKSMAIAYRFGRRELMEMGVLYAESKAVELAPDLAGHVPTATVLRTFRSLHAGAPRLVTNLHSYIRSEPQNLLPEIARVICQNPRCGRVGFTDSLLPPGSRTSVQTHSSKNCDYCGAPAFIEDHGTDENGRVWRQFADRVLSDPETTLGDLQALQNVLAKAPSETTERTTEAIAAISPKLADLAERTRAGVDRFGYLKRIASLAGMVAAILLTPSVANDVRTSATSAETETAAPSIGDKIAIAQSEIAKRQVDAIMQKLKDPSLPIEQLQALQDGLKSASDANARVVLRKTLENLPGGTTLIDIAASESNEGIRDILIGLSAGIAALVGDRLLKRKKAD